MCGFVFPYVTAHILSCSEDPLAGGHCLDAAGVHCSQLAYKYVLEIDSVDGQHHNVSCTGFVCTPEGENDEGASQGDAMSLGGPCMG